LAVAGRSAPGKMMGPGSMWFMDAAALGGWTARGTAKVLQERLLALPDEQRPTWMVGLTTPKLEELLTKVIVDAVEASQVVQEYMDSEREKGREFEEIYADVKPYLDRVSRPIEEDLKDGTLNTSTDDLMGIAEIELEAKAAAKEKKSARAPHRNLASTMQSQFPTTVQPGFGAHGYPSTFRVPPYSSGPSAPPATRADRTAVARERPVSDTLRSLDLGEELVLVGVMNGWRTDEAKKKHRFRNILKPDSKTAVNSITIDVPASGSRFLIVSADKEWQWRLFPAAKGTLHRGEHRAVPAGLAMGPEADSKAGGKDFKIAGKKNETRTVEVRVSLDLEHGAKVWLVTEGSDDPAAIADADLPEEGATRPGVDYPAME